METIFSRIVNGEIPCYKIAENMNFLAFLDINPLAGGHTLVIPKVQIDYLFDLEDDLYSGLFLFSKKIARAMMTVLPCKRIGIAVIGLEIAHAHIHLVPLNEIHDLDFSKPKLSFNEEEFQSIAARISAAL